MESEQSVYKKAIESLDVGVYIWRLADPNDPASFMFEGYNKAGEQIIGAQFTPEQLGKPMHEIVPGLIKFGYHQVFFDTLKSGKDSNLPEAPYPGDGIIEPGFYIVKIHVLSPDSICVELTNTTKQKKAMEELSGMNTLMADREVKLDELRKEIASLKGESMPASGKGEMS